MPEWVQDGAIEPVARELDRRHADFMGTAVSNCDEVFRAAAGHSAAVMGISGSEPCTKAVEECGSRMSREHVSERFDAVCANAGSGSDLDSQLEGLRFLSLPTDGEL